MKTKYKKKVRRNERLKKCWTESKKIRKQARLMMSEIVNGNETVKEKLYEK